MGVSERWVEHDCLMKFPLSLILEQGQAEVEMIIGVAGVSFNSFFKKFHCCLLAATRLHYSQVVIYLCKRQTRSHKVKGFFRAIKTSHVVSGEAKIEVGLEGVLVILRHPGQPSHRGAVV